MAPGRARWLPLLTLILLLACDRRDAQPRASTSASGPAGRSAKGPASAAPAYDPDTSHRLRHTEPVPLSLSHRDEPIFVRVAFPAGAAGPVPTVVWSHGGGVTKGPNRRGREWIEILVKAGFAVIHLSHTRPDLKKVRARCEGQRLEAPDGDGLLATADCEALVQEEYGRYLKPMDIRGVLDALEALEAQVEKAKGAALRFDVERLAVAGHSGGCAATLAVAGATRKVGGSEVDFAHTMPKAFACMSPAGVGEVGWSEDSFTGIDRPLLLATGSRDEKKGTGKDWASRAGVFELVPGEALTARLFIDHPRATHGAFNLAKSSRLLHPTLKRAMVAFLDATLRASPDARAYLESRGLVDVWQQAKPGPGATDGAPPTWCWKEQGRDTCVR